jgi:hypothetical protein
MKLSFPCIIARIANLGPSGISRSAFIAPANGGTSGHRVLTVPALGFPVSDSAMRHDITTLIIRINSNSE